MRVLAEATYAYAVIITSWRAFKALHHRRQGQDESANTTTTTTTTTITITPALLASLGLLAALQLWGATPLAWAAAWLPGYHLLRAGLHCLVAAEGSQVGLVLLRSVLAPQARALERLVAAALLPKALNAALTLPQHCLQAVFPPLDAFSPYQRRKQQQQQTRRRRQSWSDSIRQRLSLSLSPRPKASKPRVPLAAVEAEAEVEADMMEVVDMPQGEQGEGRLEVEVEAGVGEPMEGVAASAAMAGPTLVRRNSGGGGGGGGGFGHTGTPFLSSPSAPAAVAAFGGRRSVSPRRASPSPSSMLEVRRQFQVQRQQQQHQPGPGVIKSPTNPTATTTAPTLAFSSTPSPPPPAAAAAAATTPGTIGRKQSPAGSSSRIRMSLAERSPPPPAGASAAFASPRRVSSPISYSNSSSENAPPLLQPQRRRLSGSRPPSPSLAANRASFSPPALAVGGLKRQKEAMSPRVVGGHM